MCVCVCVCVYVCAEQQSISDPLGSWGDADEPFAGVWSWAFTTGEQSGVLWWHKTELDD